MAACGHAALRGSTKVRRKMQAFRADIQSAPTGARAGSRCRGALYMRPGRTAGISGPSVIAVRSWRHGGMPPYGVRRGCGGKRRLFGRIFNPPLQVHAPVPGVGAHYICARDALPELVGLQSSRSGHGGMGACRPTAFGGGAAGNCGPVRAADSRPYGVRRGYGGKRGLFGRIFNPPLRGARAPVPGVGAHYICARDALPELVGLRSSRSGRGGMGRSAGVRREIVGLLGRPYRPPLRVYARRFPV